MCDKIVLVGGRHVRSVAEPCLKLYSSRPSGQDYPLPIQIKHALKNLFVTLKQHRLASIHQLFIPNKFLTLTHFMKVIQPTPECCNPPAMHTETLINPEGHPVNQSVNG